MSATTPPLTFRPGLIARGIAAFSGMVGYVIKLCLLAALNALAAWAVFVLIDHTRWLALAVLVFATAVIDWLYLVPRSWTVPAKFLIPGTVFLVGFQIVPIIFTINVAFTNYSTGHILTQSQAIAAIKINSLEPPANGRQFDLAPARNSSGDLVLLLRDETSGKTYVGTKKGLTVLPKSDVTLSDAGPPSAAKGFTLIKGAELFALDQQLREFEVPTTGDAAIQPQGTAVAVELQPTLRYNPQTDTFTRISDGKVFRDNGQGSFVAGKEELEPGWKTYTGFKNFGRILNDPLVRKPFLSIFAWTFVFAASCVFFSFAAGLFLAIALDKTGMRFQKLYRSVLVIPYAIPGFLSLLVWAGLLNDDFGVVNRSILHTSVPWLFGGNVFSWLPFLSWPRIAVIIVSVWLTTPYFFLVSMGALQSIPEELNEAARVDGGGPLAVFRRVTLPLLLVAVAPLMIASFAFNFNNFNNVYLLTGGGPYNTASSIAGNTDILISYTYKLAIASGKGSDYGLASAVAIIIFFIVAGISAFSFWRTKSLETLR
ncbi:MAG TPA: ABC transporter permease subunit [Gaiellaceae bacterium]|jgi:arabinogalactan oligomer/maltooligosaccharide transport system permease protein|nr:ABC transporter permease subunit [Gaiellaceae bacterium]